MRSSYEEIVERTKEFINNVNIEENVDLFRKLVNDILEDRRWGNDALIEWKCRGYTTSKHIVPNPLAKLDNSWMNML